MAKKTEDVMPVKVDAATPAPSAPEKPAPAKKKFRVELEGCRPLANGFHQDYLEVEAMNGEDAAEKFLAYNGIRQPGKPLKVSPQK